MSNNQQKWGTAWIVGASTGIGRELALQMQGRAGNIAVSARSKDKLTELCEGKPSMSPFPLDVTDQEGTAACFAEIEATCGPIDLAVLGAGTWSVMGIDKFDADAIKKGVDVNYLGVIYALENLLPKMLERGRGHIAIIASVAGYRGLPNAVAYSPTKAALINLAEVLKTELVGRGVTVSIVNPGFVDTPMTSKNDFPMPALMSAEDAAGRLLSGLEREDYEIIFPKRFVYAIKALGLLPNWLYFWVVKKFISKR